MIVYCNYTDLVTPHTSAFVLELFSLRDVRSFERELSACTVLSKTDADPAPVPKKLWSRTWTASQYQHVIDNLSSILRRSEKYVHILMVSFAESHAEISQIAPSHEQIHATRAALGTLQVLRSLGIAHGDISEKNVILQQTDDGYSAIWVDFSSSVLDASSPILSKEWQKAIEYFSQLVGFNLSYADIYRLDFLMGIFCRSAQRYKILIKSLKTRLIGVGNEVWASDRCTSQKTARAAETSLWASRVTPWTADEDLATSLGGPESHARDILNDTGLLWIQDGIGFLRLMWVDTKRRQLE